jgi:dephospho-CoA kinase
MIKVALTGGAASGKSTVASLLREAGLPVIDSDMAARRAVAPGKPGWQVLRQNFGPEFFRPDGSLDRQAVARQVFTQTEARRKLEKLLHPYIASEIQELILQLQSRGEPLIVVEIPLLYELGLENVYDKVIVVWADEAAQRQRLARRDFRSPDEVEGILAAQESWRQKSLRGDFRIDNSGTPSATRDQVKKIIDEIRKLLDKAE